MKLHIRSDGKLSLAESYMLPFNLRQKYIKAYNEYIDEKNSNNSA